MDEYAGLEECFLEIWVKKIFRLFSSNSLGLKSSNTNKTKEDSCGKRCNNFALTWFWITVICSVYLGFEYILPAMYSDPNTVFYNKCVCYVILIEMVVNWCFLKFVKSPFSSEKHKHYMDAHAHEVQHGGFEINMNDIKADMNNRGSFKLPKSSINSNSPVNRNLLNGTLYVIEMDDRNGFSSNNSEYQPDSKFIQQQQNGNGALPPKRKLVYPYWSWKPCIICQCPRPPRAHHCPICGTCVVKRDHHCFFSGSCVGLRNQRYFIVFTFWGVIATVYCLIQALIYFFTVYITESHWSDIILPIGLVKWVLGYIPSLDALLLILFYSVSWFCITSIAFLREQISCIKKGITSFEQDTHIKITNTNDQKQNLKGVFGDYWYLNFLFPLHWIFPSHDDGVCWHNVKA